MLDVAWLVMQASGKTALQLTAGGRWDNIDQKDRDACVHVLKMAGATKGVGEVEAKKASGTPKRRRGR